MTNSVIVVELLALNWTEPLERRSVTPLGAEEEMVIFLVIRLLFVSVNGTEKLVVPGA